MSLPHERQERARGTRPARIQGHSGRTEAAHQEKKTICLVDRGEVTPTALKKVIRSFMFVKIKFDGMGRFEKSKLD